MGLGTSAGLVVRRPDTDRWACLLRVGVGRLRLRAGLLRLDVDGGSAGWWLRLGAGLLGLHVDGGGAGWRLTAVPAGDRRRNGRHRPQQTEREHRARNGDGSRPHGQHTTTRWKARLASAPAKSRVVTKNASALPDRSVAAVTAPPAPPIPASPWVTTGVQNETFSPKSTS